MRIITIFRSLVAVTIVTKYKLKFSQVTKRSKYQTFEPPEIKSNPLLAINEMCNYITACSCHLENWYFVTHLDSFLLPLTLLTLSLYKMFIKIKYRVKIIRKKNGSSLHTLALLVSLHFFCHVSCDRSFPGLTYSTIILSLTEW